MKVVCQVCCGVDVRKSFLVVQLSPQQAMSNRITKRNAFQLTTTTCIASVIGYYLTIAKMFV